MCRTEKTVEQRAARDEEEGEDGEEVAYADVDGARQGEGCVGEEGDDERQKFYLPANEEPPHGPRERRDRDEQERQAGLEREGDGEVVPPAVRPVHAEQRGGVPVLVVREDGVDAAEEVGRDDV